MSNNHLDHHDPVDPARPVLERIHPWIYAIAVGLVAWFALSAWVLFDHGFGQHSEGSLSLTMVSVLFLVAVLLPWTLLRVWTRHRIREEGQPSDVALRDWGLRDFSVWGAKIKGSHAAIDILLPLAAVTFGLTAIGIVFLIEARFAS